MIRLFTVRSDTFDVCRNQALEKYLLDRVKEDEIILYLWRNDHTVVIGKNQDAYGECHVETLYEDGGFLARRLSGGGAVYHDKGNLNFTFLCKRDLYDVQRQDRIILDALEHLGIRAEKNGRNDLTINGRKFSGHAYYKGKENCFHHGTIMLEVNEEALEKYLNVSLVKLHSKAVKSVRSRVINLKQIRNDLDTEILSEELIRSFEQMYGTKSEPYSVDEEEIMKMRSFFASEEWIFGPSIDLKRRKEARFDWGTVRIFYDLDDGVIEDVKIYTDAMDPDIAQDLEEKLKGKKTDELTVTPDETGDVIGLLKEDDEA